MEVSPPGEVCSEGGTLPAPKDAITAEGPEIIADVGKSRFDLDF